MNDTYTMLPVNPDGTVTLYYHTTRLGAAVVIYKGYIQADGIPVITLTSRDTPDIGMGDTALSVRVKPECLVLSAIGPQPGRRDYEIYVVGPEGKLHVSTRLTLAVK